MLPATKDHECTTIVKSLTLSRLRYLTKRNYIAVNVSILVTEAV